MLGALPLRQIEVQRALSTGDGRLVRQALIEVAYVNCFLLKRDKEEYTHLQQVLAHLKAALADIHPSLARAESAHILIHVAGRKVRTLSTV